jgi:hypothetical protein
MNSGSPQHRCFKGATMSRPNPRLQFLIDAIKSQPPDNCLVWPFPADGDGYGRIAFDGRLVRVSRVVFLLTHGRWPNPCARHTCDNPRCFNPSHVIEGTQGENMADKVLRGRITHGEGLPQSKLTEEAVRKIREEYQRETQEALAAKYGVSRSNISLIVNYKHWKSPRV